MRRLAWLLGLGLLAANVAVPAFGGDTALTRVLRLDKRETRHYKDLDRRIKAAGLLALQPPSTSTVSAPMTARPNGFYGGYVNCPGSSRMTGGGVDWGNGSLYSGYHVVSSWPFGNGGWQAVISVGGAATPPSTTPRVYAVCAT